MKVRSLKNIKVGLFVPCYIEQFYPNVAIASLELLEKLGCQVAYPLEQTCCGQPMANAGCESDAAQSHALFVKNFSAFSYVVAPSGSCVLHVREHLHHIPQSSQAIHVRENTYELCEFLLEVVGVKELAARFSHRVGLHLSCHGQRGMRMAQSSEIVGPEFSKLKELLSMVEGLELVQLDRKDECCGFGGSFCVSEEAVSARMGQDRIADHHKNGAEIITGSDVSCLMHLEGLLRRQNLPIKTMHFSEILNQALS